VIVVDTSVIMALLEREPDAKVFADAMGQQYPCLISSVSVLEASIVLAGRRGDSTSWNELDDLIVRLGLEVRPHDAALTQIARDAFLRYGKGRHPAKLNFGDCAAYALAKSEDCALLFKGNDFKKTDIQAAV
jgi:ribonuclease VapC